MNDHSDPTPPQSCRVAPEMGSHNLLRVVPVGQQQQSGTLWVLIYSLELYATGFIAIVRVSWTSGSGMLPRLTWTASNEHGTVLPFADRAGSGGGRPPDHFSWRIGCMFGAPIPAGSSRLDLSVTAPDVAGTNEPLRFVVPLDVHTPA